MQYKNLKVTIKDTDGKVVRSRIDEKNAKEIELDILGTMKVGKTYTVTISGIRTGGSGSYTTITSRFTAR